MDSRRGILLILGLLLLAGFFLWFWETWRDHRFDAAILAAAKRYGADPALVKAVIWRESRFNPRARGKAGEVGLMQIMSPAASEWAKAEHLFLFTQERLFDPNQNILAGTWYLQKLWKRYQTTDNPLPYTLADYNAGRNNVLKWTRGAAATNSARFIEQIGFPSTKNYVGAVMKRREYYRRSLPKTARTDPETGWNLAETAAAHPQPASARN